MSIDHLALVGTAVSDAAGRLVSVPLRIALTLAGSALTIVIVRVLITRLVHGIVHGGRLVRTRTRAALQRGQDLPGRTATNALSETRRVQRGKTIGSVLRSTATLVIGAITVVMVLDLLGIPTGPILASAGIAGIALGFGAQTLVKDFLSGLFMLVEDQYGIGDVIDLGEASGTVEAIGLRVTQVRDINGTLWFVRNGEVVRVGNKTQGWSRAVVEVRIDQADDIDHAQALLLKAAQEVADDPEIGPLLLDEPAVAGIEDLTAEGAVLRLMVKVAPSTQWDVARALRARVRIVLADGGISLALPRREVFVERPTPAVTVAETAVAVAEPDATVADTAVAEPDVTVAEPDAT